MFAGLLESASVAETWENSLEARFYSLREQVSLGDLLASSAVDAAQRCKNLLGGKDYRKVGAALEKLQLDELRVELRAIARDLRLGAK